MNQIEHDINIHDVTYENAQARQRTYLLMDFANEHNGMVIGTGDMSELALGWATYNAIICQCTVLMQAFQKHL